jgi:glycosyltransferase involved in cell wall biosynthesis
MLESVYREIPVCHLIVVDGYSTDRTLEIVRKYPNVKIIRSRKSLGKCREIGIKEVDTEWFVFVDSDVILNKGWLRKIKNYIQPMIGAVEGLDMVMNPARGAMQLAMERLKKLRGHPIAQRRAFTGDTLIRIDAVKGIEIPEHIPVFEDEFIKKYVERRGYKWVKTREHLCKHYDFKSPKSAEFAAETACFVGYLSVKDYLYNLIKLLPKLLYAFYITQEWTIFLFQIKLHFYSLRGAIKGQIKKNLLSSTQSKKY